MMLLIAEHRELMRVTLQDFLQPLFPELRIQLAESGARALALCASDRPQLVLMDLGLTDVRGLKLIARLRACSPAPAVIVISAQSGPEYADRAQAAGACALIPKDRLFSELVPAIARALGVPDPTRKPRAP